MSANWPSAKCRELSLQTLTHVHQLNLLVARATIGKNGRARHLQLLIEPDKNHWPYQGRLSFFPQIAHVEVIGSNHQHQTVAKLSSTLAFSPLWL